MAPSMPSRATSAPLIVPERTSSSTASEREAADRAGDERARRPRGRCRWRRRPAARTGRGTQPRRPRWRAGRPGSTTGGRCGSSSSAGSGGWARRRPARRGQAVGRWARTSSTVRCGGRTRSTWGANSDPASTVRDGPSATTSPPPSTTTRVAQRAASSRSWVASTTAPPPAAWAVAAASRDAPGRGVDPPGRLVEQQHGGAADGHRGDGDPLALTGREAARVPVGEVGRGRGGRASGRPRRGRRR